MLGRSKYNLKKWVLDPILPPRCPISGDIVDQENVLSPQSWAGLSFLSRPFCKKCGYPFAYGQEDTGEKKTDAALFCGNCLKTPPDYDRARAALAYNETSRRLILSFKYGDQHQTARIMAGFASRQIPDASFYDAIIPVPLHKSRLIRRRFNQSAVLARCLCHLRNIAYRPDLLIRGRATPPQKDKNKKQRRHNVRNAFIVPEKARSEISDGRFIVLDDVYTTGATVNECARVLKKAGAKEVHVLTIARVVEDALNGI